MTVLEWDKVGERIFETGIDRGVLYLTDGGAVPWNGLTSVVETRTRELKPYYIDGIQYLVHNVPGTYAAKVQAFTYPDELDQLLGTMEYTPGVFLHDQRARMFHLSYRTRIGNDVDGTDHGYKIHIVYNIMASPGDSTFETLSDSLSPQLFEWNLMAVPPLMVGEARPTSHISIDSRTINTEDQPNLLSIIEEYLYGSDEADPSLPNMFDLLFMIETVGGSIIIS
jgi:hypothetical protein